MSEDAELPKALVKRIAKAKLATLEGERAAADGKEARDIQISKDALLALSESARVFIHYLTATGNDICKESKRQIMSVDDIFSALEDLEFSELLPPLKESLEGFKVENKEKSKKRAEQQKKRKLEDAERQAAEAARAAAGTVEQQNAPGSLQPSGPQTGVAPAGTEGPSQIQQPAVATAAPSQPASGSPSLEPSSKIPKTGDLEAPAPMTEPEDTVMQDANGA